MTQPPDPNNQAPQPNYPPPDQGFPPPDQGYPPPGQGYPPPGQPQGYPPPGQGYPPPGQGYPPPGQPQGYPPPGQGYPPPGQGYPPPGQGYPPPPGQPQGYPPQQQSFPSAPPMAAGYGYGQAAPGSAPPGMYLDPESGLPLPQGIQLASVGRRVGAFFLAGVLFIITLGIGYVVWGLVIWGRGQTPALQVLGMRVWHPESRQVATFGRMALREIAGRIVEGLLSVISLLVSFILMVTGRERKTIHDYIASTVVLYDPDKRLAPR